MDQNSDERLRSARFPKSSQYHPNWVLAGVSGGANPLWLAEWLTEGLELRPGLRVLDLGCGRGLSSIFLHHEFGVRVWAVDLWFSPSECYQRIRDAGVEEGVFPVQADARSLPFASEYFDAIVAIDSFFYFGTDDLYLGQIGRFLKPGGVLGIAGAGLIHEFDGAVPEHLRAWWSQDQPWCLHSASWWRRHWERTGIVEVMQADSLEDGWQWWRAWQEAVAPDNAVELAALEADRGRNLGYVRVVGRRCPDVSLAEPVVSIATEYRKQPLQRGSE